jgi:hypothetical protein
MTSLRDWTSGLPGSNTQSNISNDPFEKKGSFESHL